MATIALQNTSSQGEDLPIKSTTIPLKDSSAKPGSQPKEVKTLREARILPDGAEPIMSETENSYESVISEKDGDVFVNNHYFIPYIHGGKLFVREIQQTINNHQEVHTIECYDKTGMQGRIHNIFCPDGDSVEDFEEHVLNPLTQKDDTTPPVQAELNGKPALIFRRLNYTGKENLYLAYYGDQKTIAKLLQRYKSGAKTRQAGAGVRGAVGKLPKEPEKGLFARLLQSLKKRS